MAGVGVEVGGTGVGVGDRVGRIGVSVGVPVAVSVGVAVGTAVMVTVAVVVGDTVGVQVGVVVQVAVGTVVGVPVGVGHGGHGLMMTIKIKTITKARKHNAPSTTTIPQASQVHFERSQSPNPCPTVVSPIFSLLRVDLPTKKPP